MLFRSGFGVFKEMPLFYQYSVALFHPPQANRINLRDILTWPNPLRGIDPRTGTLQPTVITYDYKYPYAMQYNFGIERQFGQDWVARATFIGTRGVDVGAKAEIYALINELAAQGKAIVVVSSDHHELMGISDRILVMGGGRLRGQLLPADYSEENIVALSLGIELQQRSAA